MVEQLARFTEPLLVEKVITHKKKKLLGFIPFGYKSTQSWRLTRGFRYYLYKENSNVWIDVLPGFVTDFSSVPDFFQGIYPKDDVDSQAAVLHDWLYKHKGVLPEGTYGGKATYSRKEADDTFLDAMKILKQSFTKRRAKYRAVRLGGWVHWR